MTTRLDVTTRLELLTNRREWLRSELGKLHDEDDRLEAEINILTDLARVYAANPTDAIDAERAAFEKAINPAKPRTMATKGDVSSLVVMAIEELGEAQTRDIVRATGLEPKQVSNAVFNLKTQGVIAADGRTYTMAE